MFSIAHKLVLLGQALRMSFYASQQVFASLHFLAF
jgi:hypothetical protein